MINIVILSNEYEDDHSLWMKACDKYVSDINYRVVNLTQSNWLEEIRKKQVDFLLAKPSHLVYSFKHLYDERIHILSCILDYKVFPTWEEIHIYENKRYLSFWLEANQIPHPKTLIFYNRIEAINYSLDASYPIVAKLNTGASGNGVSILKNQKEARTYINKIFNKGIRPRTGPRIANGYLLKRLINKLIHFNELKKKLHIYKSVATNPQYGFCLFQQYIYHTYEWRVVRIGDSFFAHKKLVRRGKASGSLVKKYDPPPISLLDFVRSITDKHSFYSQAIDIFQTSTDKFLVNEMQCIFGQSDPHQMKVDGKPGRYIYSQEKWIFEEGDFCTNECFDHRIDFIVRKLMNNTKPNE